MRTVTFGCSKSYMVYKGIHAVFDGMSVFCLVETYVEKYARVCIVCAIALTKMLESIFIAIADFVIIAPIVFGIKQKMTPSSVSGSLNYIMCEWLRSGEFHILVRFSVI